MIARFSQLRSMLTISYKCQQIGQCPSLHTLVLGVMTGFSMLISLSTMAYHCFASSPSPIICIRSSMLNSCHLDTFFLLTRDPITRLCSVTFCSCLVSVSAHEHTHTHTHTHTWHARTHTHTTCTHAHTHLTHTHTHTFTNKMSLTKMFLQTPFRITSLSHQRN